MKDSASEGACPAISESCHRGHWPLLGCWLHTPALHPSFTPAQAEALTPRACVRALCLPRCPEGSPSSRAWPPSCSPSLKGLPSIRGGPGPWCTPPTPGVQGSYCMFTEHLLTQVPPHTDVLPGSLLAGTRSQKQKPCLVPNALLFRETSRPTESCSWTPPTSTPLTVLQPRPCFRLLAELTRHLCPSLPLHSVAWWSRHRP